MPPIRTGARRRSAQKPAIGDAGANAAVEPASALAALVPQSLYPALHDMSPDDQARHLAIVLCWDPVAATAELTPIALGEFLSTVPTERRREALTAYWQAQLHGARASALEQQLEQFEALGAAITSGSLSGPDATSPAAMLLVRAARLAADADARDAQVDRLAAHWTLTAAAGRPLNGAWLAPETPPHAGGYRLGLKELPRELLDSAVVQRLTTTIPQLRQSIVDRAAAVVSADVARGAVAAPSGGALAATARALDNIREQTEETLTFLARLTEYNIEIAAYAGAVLPPATTSQSLVRALVATTPTTNRRP